MLVGAEGKGVKKGIGGGGHASFRCTLQDPEVSELAESLTYTTLQGGTAYTVRDPDGDTRTLPPIFLGSVLYVAQTSLV